MLAVLHISYNAWGAVQVDIRVVVVDMRAVYTGPLSLLRPSPAAVVVLGPGGERESEDTLLYSQGAAHRPITARRGGVHVHVQSRSGMVVGKAAAARGADWRLSGSASVNETLCGAHAQLRARAACVCDGGRT
jgi:hypothetical protein